MGKRKKRFTVLQIGIKDKLDWTWKPWLDYSAKHPFAYGSGYIGACYCAYEGRRFAFPIIVSESRPDEKGMIRFSYDYGPEYILIGERWHKEYADVPRGLEAVVWHELGHIKRYAILGPGNIHDLDAEVFADIYSARHVGKLPIIEVLSRICHVISNDLLAETSDSGHIYTDDDTKRICECQYLIYRLARLEHTLAQRTIRRSWDDDIFMTSELRARYHSI